MMGTVIIAMGTAGLSDGSGHNGYGNDDICYGNRENGRKETKNTSVVHELLTAETTPCRMGL